MLYRIALASFSTLLLPLLQPALGQTAPGKALQASSSRASASRTATACQPQGSEALSPQARALVERAFADLGGLQPVDYHVHLLGLGAGGTGAYANPRLLGWGHPLSRVKARAIFKSSGITDEARADAQYVERLLALAEGFPVRPRLALLAYDYRYTREGFRDLAGSEFAMPDEYVLGLARRHPESVIPVVSVHPYAPDALQRLEACARAGARMVKWLPNAQGMDPSDPAIDPYYRLMARYGMALLCHTGLESSVEAGAQRLGNPLLLRRPLDLGVTVVMAHAGNRGSSDDLDNPGRRARNFELFLRMMDDPRYQGRLFADISMLTQALRSRSDMETLLERSDLHPRLVNGSDYPLPAVDVLILPGLLRGAGFITGEERRALSEIYRANPLLFDFVLKRALRHPRTGARFPAEMFVTHPALARTAVPEQMNAHASGGE